MKFSSLTALIAALAVTASLALAPASQAAPVRDKGPTILKPGNIPQGMIFIRDVRGRILFSAPATDYRYGREIDIHPYDTTNGKLDVTIEGPNGVITSQRLRGNRGQYLGVFYNRSLGGFKVRNRGRLFHENSN